MSGRYALGPRFYYQAYYAVMSIDVGKVLGFEFFPCCLLPLGNRGPCVIFAIQTVEGLVVGCFSVVDTMLFFGNEALKGFWIAGDSRRCVGAFACGKVLMRPRAIVQRSEQLADEPDLIAFWVIAPGAAQNDELDFVGDVPHFGEGLEARSNLQVGIEEGALGALTRRFVGQVTFGHA